MAIIFVPGEGFQSVSEEEFTARTRPFSPEAARRRDISGAPTPTIPTPTPVVEEVSETERLAREETRRNIELEKGRSILEARQTFQRDLRVARDQNERNIALQILNRKIAQADIEAQARREEVGISIVTPTPTRAPEVQLVAGGREVVVAEFLRERFKEEPPTRTEAERIIEAIRQTQGASPEEQVRAIEAAARGELTRQQLGFPQLPQRQPLPTTVGGLGFRGLEIFGEKISETAGILFGEKVQEALESEVPGVTRQQAIAILDSLLKFTIFSSFLTTTVASKQTTAQEVRRRGGSDRETLKAFIKGLKEKELDDFVKGGLKELEKITDPAAKIIAEQRFLATILEVKTGVSIITETGAIQLNALNLALQRAGIQPAQSLAEQIAQAITIIPAKAVVSAGVFAAGIEIRQPPSALFFDVGKARAEPPRNIFIQKTAFGQEQGSLFFKTTAPILSSLEITRQSQLLKQPQLLSTQQRLRLRQIQQIQQKQLQRQLQSTLTTQIQKQQLRQQLRQLLTFRTSLRTGKPLTKLKVPPPIIPLPKPTTKEIKAERIIKRLAKEFDVFVRKKGKDIKIADDLIFTKAKKLLKKRLDTSLRASGFIEDSFGKKVKVDLGFGFRPSKVDPLRIVEKKQFRLDSPGEIKAIKAARKAAPKKSKSKKKKNNPKKKVTKIKRRKKKSNSIADFLFG